MSDNRDLRVFLRLISSHVGKNLVSVLTEAGIPCTYLLLPALGSYLSSSSGNITSVLLGAHSIHADGAVYSRSGTALVAMMARTHNVPVLVACETYKFSEAVVLDGFTKNELGMHTFYSTFLVAYSHT